jgi:adenine deaminase
LKSEVAIALGTDSAITGDGDLLDELRFARNAAEPRRLYDMVTSQPARMFDLPAGFGTIADGGPADFLVMKDNGHTPAVTLLESNPELVAVRGRVHLITEELAKACRTDLLALQLQQIDVEGRGKYWIAAPVSEMLRQTKQALPGLTRLAGKAIAA